MTAPTTQTNDHRAAHIKTYVGEVGKVTARRTASGEWAYTVSCNQCVLRWWKDGADASELIAAWLMHEAGHASELRRRMALAAKGDITREDGDQNKRGISHLIALALTIMDIDVVRRTTIRALLPASGNGVTSQANRAYRTFEKAGWVTRFEPSLIRVNDTESLFGWVTNSQDVSPERALTMLRIGVAAKTVAAEVSPLGSLLEEVRRRELMALHRLMERAPGSVTNQRGHVRLVPKSRPL